MARTRRDDLKMCLANAINHGDWMLYHLLKVKSAFQEQHPEYVEYIDHISECVVMAQEFILDFWEKAWGSRPKNLEGWK